MKVCFVTGEIVLYMSTSNSSNSVSHTVEQIAAIINLVVWLSSTKVDESDIDLFVRINAAERAGWSYRVRRPAPLVCWR